MVTDYEEFARRFIERAEQRVVEFEKKLAEEEKKRAEHQNGEYQDKQPQRFTQEQQKLPTSRGPVQGILRRL